MRAGLAGWCGVWMVCMVWVVGLGCGGGAGLVVYVSQDQVFAEPVLREFERVEGVRVRAVYDGEATKTVGLANRILAERGQPQCDVFWSNEELRVRHLERAGVLASGVVPVTFGVRARTLVVNTGLVAEGARPSRLEQLTEPAWRGRVVMAYPMFGTTATHFLVLRQAWGEARWEAWCRGLLANGVRFVDGNSAVVRWVGRGEASVGLTDSDDVAAGVREGLPVAAVALAEAGLAIPNAVAVVSGRQVETSQRLVRFLAGADVRRRLIAAGALDGEEESGEGGLWLRPEWDELLAGMDDGVRAMEALFLR